MLLILNGDNMIDTHGVYDLKVEGVIYYRGYCCNRPLGDRLKEHIYSAQYPSKKEIENRAIRGKPSAKDQIILAALSDGLELTIEKVYEAPLYEPVYEEHWINHARNEGHLITNIAVGGTWQPYCLVDGELVEVDRESTDYEIRQQVQNFKQIVKNRPKKVKVPVVDPVKLLSEEEKQEMFNRELSVDVVNFIGKCKGGKSSIRN